MVDTQFKAMLEILIHLVIFELLYFSFLYNKMETENTKLWHLSQSTLANLLNK